MSDLDELLGHAAAAAELLDTLKLDGVRAVRLTGPPGAGKSHVGGLVGEAWQHNAGRVFRVDGDPGQASRPLFPWLVALTTAPLRLAPLGAKGTRSIVQVAGTVTGTGAAGTTVFDTMASAFRQRRDRALRPYSDVEREVILDLRRLAKNKPVLIIADNIHWWDESSLWLLGEILSPRLRAALPSLDLCSVLVIDTARDQASIAPEAFASFLADNVAHEVWLDRVPRAAFPEVLRHFGWRPPTDQVELVDALFSASAGHLKLAEQLAAYASSTDLAEMVETGQIEALVRNRILTLGSKGQDLLDLLQRAAVIGLTFDIRDLACLSQRSAEDVDQLVATAETSLLLRRLEAQVAFAHDVIRTAIVRGQQPGQIRDLNAQLEECLRTLRPGDYAARAIVSQAAGDVATSRSMYALAAVSRLRDGATAARVLREVQLAHPDDAGLVRYVEAISTALDLIAQGKFWAALGRLRERPNGETMEMVAERVYLEALCLMEGQTIEGAEIARGVLDDWLPDLRAEGELGQRFLLLRQQAEVLAEDFAQARTTESTIDRRLLGRASYDPEAARALQIQNRRAAAINVPEIAELRILDAVHFFRTSFVESGRDRVELYRSLTNLVAVQLRLNKAADAWAAASECEALVQEEPDDLPRLDVFGSNLVLAGVRSGNTPITTATTLQRLVVEATPATADSFLQRCNLAAFLSLAGDDGGARQELRVLNEQIEREDITETYLQYYASVVSIGAAALAGQTDRAVRWHDAMGNLVHGLRWPTAPYIRRRYELLGPLLASSDFEDRLDADLALVTSRPDEVGPAWNYYARLVPCCELSFWSDS